MNEHSNSPIERWPAERLSPEYAMSASSHLSDELLAAHTAGELADDERAMVRHHLESCAYCTSALEHTQSIRAFVRAAAVDTTHTTASVSVVAQVLARLPEYSRIDVADSTPRALPSASKNTGHVSTPGSRFPRSRRHNIWRQIVAVAAVLLLVALSALLFTQISGRALIGRSTFPHGPAGVENIPGNWAEVLPKGSRIFDVAVVSSTDIWAVGESNNGVVTSALLMHFDGMQWQTSPDQFPFAYLTSISMVSAHDGWASGATTANKPIMLHYAGGHWHDATALVDTSGMTSTSMLLNDVRMASPTSGWALGEDIDHPNASSQIFEYERVGDGFRWEPVLSFANTLLAGLSVVSDHEVWMSGETTNGTGSSMLRITVSSVAGPNGPINTTWDTHTWDIPGSILSTNMLSSTNGWVAGIAENGVGILYHWDGRQWSQKPFAPAGYEGGAIGGIVMTREGTGWVYGSDVNFLYSTANGQWFSYPMPDGSSIVKGALVTPTTFLAITVSGTTTDTLRYVPMIFEMKDGTLIPTATSSLP